MTRRGELPATVVLAVLVLLVALGASACSIGPASDGATASAAAGTGAPPARSPGGPAIPTVTQEAATTSPWPGHPAPTTPPAAVLRGPSVESVRGIVGGYVYGDSGSAAPWIPAPALQAVTLPPRAPLAIVLDPDVTAGWSLRTAAVSDTQGEEPRSLAEGEAPAADGSIRFVGPPAGRWVLEARITYAGGLGDGAYYWLLDVTPR